MRRSLPSWMRSLLTKNQRQKTGTWPGSDEARHNPAPWIRASPSHARDLHEDIARSGIDATPIRAFVCCRGAKLLIPTRIGATLAQTVSYKDLFVRRSDAINCDGVL